MSFDLLSRLDFSDTDYLRSIQERPKAEVHRHIDGSVSADFALARWTALGVELRYPTTAQDGTPLPNAGQPITTPQELGTFWRDWTTYSIPDRFATITGLMQTKEGIQSVCREFVGQLHAENIQYCEARFAPQYHLEQGLTPEQVIQYAKEGLEQTCMGTDCTVKLIVSIGREIFMKEGTWNPAAANEIVYAAINQKVAGLDLACWEVAYPPELAYEAVQVAHLNGLPVTIHAGEMCDSAQWKMRENMRNLFTAVYVLGAQGLGHAIPLRAGNYTIHDVLQTVVDKHIRMEACPISNMATGDSRNVRILGPGDLHLDQLDAKGVNVTVNSDDPAMWRHGSLSENLYQMGVMYGDAFVHAVTTNAIISAFGLTKDEKIQTLRNFEKAGLKVNIDRVNRFFGETV